MMTSSSTEAELVAVSDTMPKILWCRHFMEEQGCIVENVYVYQDNQNAILLETNGHKSVGKWTRNVNINYFFVTDKVKDNKMKILYCLKKEMMADFYTKPLQASLFKKYRDAILGITENDIPLYMEQYAQYINQRLLTKYTITIIVSRSLL